MAGVNLPTFGILDNLNLEVEYNTAQFINGYRWARESKIPLPDFDYNASEGYNPDDWDDDNFKWSVYFEKTITKGLSIMGQAASDVPAG